MTYTNWYEGTFPDKREESVKRDREERIFRGKKAGPETLERRAMEAKRDGRANRCGACFLAMPVGQPECDCGWQRPAVKIGIAGGRLK
jgi:hypothetical protein